MRPLERTRALGRALRRQGPAMAIGAVLAVTAACSAIPASSPTTTAPVTTVPAGGPTATTTPATMTHALYFLRGSYLGVSRRAMPATSAVARATLSALLVGPSAAERRAGLSTAVPAGTTLTGIAVAFGTATVDLGSSFADVGAPGDELARVAQVVYTLTQFPNVTQVVFKVDGTVPETFAGGAVSLRKPLRRVDVLGALPAILVETPAVGDALHGSVHLTGLANVFEAQFDMQLVDGNGHVLADEPVEASAGTGTWGTFDATFPFAMASSTTGTLRVFDTSLKDGSPVDEVDIPVSIGP